MLGASVCKELIEGRAALCALFSPREAQTYRSPAHSRSFHGLPRPSTAFHGLPSPPITFHDLPGETRAYLSAALGIGGEEPPSNKPKEADPMPMGIGL